MQTSTTGVIDAWIQHPSPSFARHPRFASLRRWSGSDAVSDEIPLDLTVHALAAAGVTRAPLYAECIELAIPFCLKKMIALATKYPNVYIDTSAYEPSRYPPSLVAYLRGHGRPRQRRPRLRALISRALNTAAKRHSWRQR